MIIRPAALCHPRSAACSSGPGPAPDRRLPGVRELVGVGGVVASLSVTSDLTRGHPPGEAMRACLLATELARRAGMDLVRQSEVYYGRLLRFGRHWQRWSSTRTIILPSGAITGNPAAAAGAAAAGNASIFAKYIAKGYFSYVALNFTDTSALDHGLATLLHHNPHYHTIQVVPYGIEVPPFGQGTYVIWKIRAPALTEVPGPVHALPADSGS